MPETRTKILQCVEKIHQIAANFKPRVALILGSGLGELANQLEQRISINYQDLPGFYLSALAGHSKQLHLGFLKGIPVLCLEGRSHFYEGSEAKNSLKVMIRTIKQTGCEFLFSTNAVGSLNADRGPGNLMIIKDHINFLFDNPLIGANDDEVGERFVSMDNAYDAEIRARFLTIAQQYHIPLQEGIYIATSGPTFETHAEIRMFQKFGGDAIGMSTVPETILARHCGLKVASICAITNLGAGLSSEILSHEGTLRGAQLATEHLVKLFMHFFEAGNF